MGSIQVSSDAALQAAQLFNVDGMVAAVTGGGTGIGLMMARALAENGATVYILGRRAEVLEAATKSIGKPTVKTIVCDVTSKDSLKAAADTVQRDVGYLNLLVCNSGIGGPQTPRPTMESSITLEEFANTNWDVPMEDYTNTFAVNTSAVWYTTMAFLTLLDAGNKKGNLFQKSQVIATSSIGGFNKVNTGGFAYGQSKAACTHLIKHLAVALPKWDIRANVICPGLYPSEMSAPIIERGGGVGKDMVPLGRAGDAADMGGALLYLASRAGAYCNGAVIVSDGGRLGTFPSTF
ncbi:hypothetical protein JX265_001220 [Neoarthrinium moseri]|uniref:Uncharacterized protein n=1 Tax=Neoarthrinium moseri TaxID=1658444 RepID=A0A9P9WXL4_9PEZI|nr:uncharacterized protein JN550_007395 [Neoarthrinium moseri]KAI1848890.1 hypothetical protein JX266_005318 [Neoarthrinium moseri]KAI1866848.1 hypothetical protein JN550_007395 [Neoarthrinium moseri]KAI1880980.1 hypothetical protein JX265_001220 [Neoarthrinium moseri]